MKKREQKMMLADILLCALILGIIFCRMVRMDVFKERFSDRRFISTAGEEISSAFGESRVLTDERYTAPAVGDETGPQTESTAEKKKIALTFDDGPNPEYTPLLLEGLRERNVQATFFLLGTAVETYPEIVEEMYRDGHEIGIHSYEHVNLSTLAEKDACAQIQKTCDLIYEITGIRPSFVRPPYGNWLSCLDDDFCMIPVFWDIDPLDWATQDASAVLRKILDDIEEYDIILLHDASSSSVQAALQAIDILTQEDYEFVTVDELIFP